ncbi:MAG: LysR family transcriptional regulator [Oscillospiraceae bacterium]
MTIRHLRIFVAVCSEGSTTKAAEKLYLAQPTVSLAISELEKHYNVRLFDRISKRLHLTDAGRRFLQYAQHITGLFDEMEEGVRRWETSGTLRLGSSITIGSRLLPGLIRRFSEGCPDVEVKARIGNSEEIEQLVLDNRVDFGLIEGLSHSPYLHSEIFLADELVLVCPPGHSWTAEGDGIRVEELAEERLLMRERGSGGRELLESILRLHDLEVEPAWESTSTQAIIGAVAEGLGVAVLPLLLVEQPLKEGRLQRVAIRDVSFQRNFVIIHHKNKYLTAFAKEFIELCMECRHK